VSWNDAVAYVEWLSEQTGHKYRLPTEAEWEYAARAGTETARDWGNDPNKACSYANVHDNTSKAENGFSWKHHECTDGYAKTAPVGSFKPNTFELFDVLGNVWEWTCSEYESKYGGKELRCTKNINKNNRLSFRGGSWYYGVASWMRSANRFDGSASLRGIHVGFRVARF
jgi:formylglycine-generating enzyme required for sulfatase activity